MTTQTVRFQRMLRSTPERIWRAFLEPQAWAKWLPPHGFYAVVHAHEARVGGRWRMSFVNLTSGGGHSFGGEYLELVPHQRLRYSAVFDDPNLPGTLTTSVTLTPGPFGVELEVVQDGIPAVIPREACLLGWQESLQQLAQLVEPEIPG